MTCYVSYKQTQAPTDCPIVVVISTRCQMLFMSSQKHFITDSQQIMTLSYPHLFNFTDHNETVCNKSEPVGHFAHTLVLPNIVTDMLYV